MQALHYSLFHLPLYEHLCDPLSSLKVSPTSYSSSHTSQLLLFYDPMKMLGKKMDSVKKLAKKVKVIRGGTRQVSHYECLLSETDEPTSLPITPTGFFAVYVGEERQRFVVPTSFLTHPLFRMLLEKAQNEFGFEQRNGLVVPCSVSAFQEVVSSVECCHGQFDIGRLVEEFIS